MNDDTMMALVEQAVGDFGSILTGALVVLGDRLVANLTTSWIPALEGVEAKLQAGARVADIGCGHGASTVIMAQAYPDSTFVEFDYHEPLSLIHI